MIWWLAQNTITAALLAAVVGVVCRLVRPRPAVCHALWLVVLLKLMAPPLPFWSLPTAQVAWLESAWLESQASDLAEAPAPAASDPLSYATGAPIDTPPLFADIETPDELWSDAQSDDAQWDDAAWIVERSAVSDAAEISSSEAPQAVLGAEAVAPIDQEPAPARAAIPWRTGVAALWMAMIVVMAAVQWVRIRRFGRMVARAEPAPPSLEMEVQQLAKDLGVRPPQVRVSEAVASPFIWAWGRPALVCPASLLECFTSTARRAVLLHELAHLARRDHWISRLDVVARTLWWWNPVYWCAARRLAEQAELACDAWVVSLLPSGRRVYAEALLVVCRWSSGGSYPVPALGMGGARRTFQRRLVMIMRGTGACRLPLWAGLAIGCAALITLPGWSVGEVFDPAGAAESQPTATESTEATEAAAEGVVEVTADTNADDPFGAAVEVLFSDPSAGEAVDVFLSSNGEADAELSPFAESNEATESEARLNQGLGELPAEAVVDDPLQGGNGNSASNDRIKRLEAQIQALTEQINAMKAPAARSSYSSARSGRASVSGARGAAVPGPSRAPRITGSFIPSQPAAQQQPSLPQAATTAGPLTRRYQSTATGGRLSRAYEPSDDFQTVIRARYRLPAGKAAALASFLAENLAADIEAKVVKDTLIVTAASEHQNAVALLVELMRKGAREQQNAPEGASTFESTGDHDYPSRAVNAR